MIEGGILIGGFCGWGFLARPSTPVRFHYAAAKKLPKPFSKMATNTGEKMRKVGEMGAPKKTES